MAFIGIFVVGWLLFFIFILFICLILFVFIPCLVISIVNLVQGIKNHWPKRNIIPLAITGTITILFLAFFLYLIIASIIHHNDVETTSSASQQAMQLLFMLKL